MVGKQKEHAGADWAGYGLRAHLQKASLFGRVTRYHAGPGAPTAAVNSHISRADE